MPEFTGQRDLRSYMRILWRWKWLFLALVIAAPTIAYLLEHGKPKIYQSSALVGVNEATVNTSALGNNGGSFSTSNVLAIAQLVKTSPVAQIAAAQMRPRPDPAFISSEVTASGDPTTNFLTITATDQYPQRAAVIANAFARAIGLNRQSAAISELNGTIAGIQAQLSHLPATDRTTRPGLEQQLSQLQAALKTQGNQATVLQAAVPNATPVGPHLRRTVELGLVIGLLLAFAIVMLAESADRRMRSPDDLESMTDLPMLAAIAPSAFGEGLDTTPVDEESFQMLRTAITYFNVDQPLKSILITSPGEKEGKTTVATRLAVAAARAGLRVVLVDGDLRRGGVSAKLGLRVSDGLSAVLAGHLPLESALLERALGPDVTGHLVVLPAGPPPPNASALMSSERMQGVLTELENRADMVIIDTPAALAVSDAVPLMKSASGVVLVARMNQSSRETISRLHKIIESAHGTLLGVVATGVTAGPGYEHYSQSYYTPNGHDTSEKKRGVRLRKAQQADPTPLRAVEIARGAPGTVKENRPYV
jgi:non-specific protein-tyrosine kinase